MIKQIQSRHKDIFFQVVSDSIAIIMSFLTQYYIRFSTGLFGESISFSWQSLLLGVGIFLVYWVTVFFFSGMYKKWYELSPFDELWTTLRSTFVGTFVFVFMIFYSSAGSPRMLFAVYLVLLSVLVVLGRYILRVIQKKMRGKGIIQTPVIIIGTPEKACKFAEQIRLSKNWGYKSKGIVLTSNRDDDKTDLIKEEKILGHIDDLGEIIEKYHPELLIISTDRPNHEKLIKVVESARTHRIEVKVEPDLYDIFSGRSKTRFLYSIPLISVSTQLMRPWQSAAKRLFDIVFSLFVLTVFLPLWIIIGIGVALDSRGGIFYSQKRIGMNNKPFMIYKFRSMVQDKSGKQAWTKVNDPRVTKFGRFIRKTHLDEIPQFVNVLVGDMSVVGPRPEQPKFVKEFTEIIPSYPRRHLVRPGITGWWQIRYKQWLVVDKNEIQNRLKDDFYYIENMSLRFDFEIVIRTVWCVLSGHGQA
jgi:exopolysaccharide biosynthesis polyprenyl glycosylphosphotransferase